MQELEDMIKFMSLGRQSGIVVGVPMDEYVDYIKCNVCIWENIVTAYCNMLVNKKVQICVFSLHTNINYIRNIKLFLETLI